MTPGPAPVSHRMWARVSGIAHWQPPRRVTNDDLARTLDTSDEWIRSRVGILERRIADHESVADMAARAAVGALADAGRSAVDVDLVIVATMTAENRSPSTAGVVARMIGATSPAVFDLNAACAGFSEALAVADQAIRCGDARCALVIGAERMSDFLDWTDRTTAILMADGAGAFVVEASDDRGIWPVAWGSDPELSHLVRIEAPDHRFRMEGPSVFRWAITRARDVASEALARAGITAADVDVFVPHQANARIICALGEQLGIPEEKTSFDVTRSGNTSAASIPIALSAFRSDRGCVEGKALLFGFGGGFSYSAQVIALRGVGGTHA